MHKTLPSSVMTIVNIIKLIRFSSKHEEMPSQFEQDVAEDYVCNRKIPRPKFNIWKSMKNVILALIIMFSFSILLNIYFHNNNNLLPLEYQQLQIENPKLFFWVLFLFVFFIGVLILMRRILIGIIRLYQHYASEEVRRRCLFKPTCSEYTIMALQKYGVMVGLYRSYIRLFKKCRGNIYRIDYP